MRNHCAGAIGFCEDGEDIDWLFLPVPQINFCPKCGTPVVPGARFCGKCGISLRGE
ncbi:MAG: zinc ribbon domain-containing protein [Clostridia bacterium]|nr:zinc ribbon domain-containing protein [Clostridia bacterium]